VTGTGHVRLRERGLLVSTLLAPALAVLVPGGGWLLPLLAPLTVYAAFATRVRDRRYLAAWGWGMTWAVLLFLGVVAAVVASPEVAAERVLHGEAYRQQMFSWITTGVGSENQWREFLPEHGLHLAVFVLACWATGGYLGLSMGALLMGYMSYFVASFALASSEPALGLAIAWVPWSVARVVAFVAVGALFARPLLVRRILPFEKKEWKWLVLALSGIACDVLAKTVWAAPYGEFLRGFLVTAAASFPR
jgi:hypothetical protein